MAISTSAKWFSSAMQGAPQHNGTAANFIAMLDAILVNGFNGLTLTGISVANGIATATRTNGHGYLVNSVVTIAGATPSGLNGEKRVLSVTTTTFTFDAEGIPDGSATGTITSKQSPAGWSKPFSGTGKGVYRSVSPQSPGSFYRVADYANGFGLLQAYEGMTDVDTGTNQWYAENIFVFFGRGATGWNAWADDRTVYFVACQNQNSSNNYWGLSGFGEYVSFYANDTSAEFIMGHDYAVPTNWSTTVRNALFDHHISSDASYVKCRLHKTCTGGMSAPACAARQLNDVSGHCTSGRGGPSFPSPVDQGLVLTDSLIMEYGNGNPIRGRARGGYWVLAASPFQTVFPPQTFSGVGGLEGRLMSMGWFSAKSQTGDANIQARVAFDMFGPWE